MQHRLIPGLFCLVTAASTAFASDLEPKFSIVSELTYTGICDGSAAVRIDAQTLLTAYDERNIFYAYDIWGGAPIAAYDVGKALALDDADKEMDIEGAAILGDRIWWVGSHGFDGKGNEAQNRKVLFSTNIPSRDLQDIKVMSQPVDLLELIQDHPDAAFLFDSETVKRAPKEGGINIEGLSAGSAGELVVGFRSPLTGEGGLRGAATVITLTNKEGLLAVKSVDALDLENRGVREITSQRAGFMILAGPVGAGSGSGLYHWDGAAETVALLANGLAALNPETILQINDQWLILSDDGKESRPDSEAKDGDRKCDKIRKKNSLGAEHESVYFRGVVVRE